MLGKLARLFCLQSTFLVTEINELQGRDRKQSPFLLFVRSGDVFSTAATPFCTACRGLSCGGGGCGKGFLSTGEALMPLMVTAAILRLARPIYRVTAVTLCQACL